MRQSAKTRALVCTVLAAAVLLACGVAMAKPDTLNRDEIADKYKWDLGDIYRSWDEWEADMQKMEGLMERYAGFEGSLDQGPERLLEVFELDDEMGQLSYKLYRFPALTSSLDTRDNEVAARLQRVRTMFARFGTATAWFSPEMLRIPWETMKGWLDGTPELAPYRFGVEDLYRQQAHVLSEDKETLLSYFSPLSGAPNEAYSQLSTSDIEYPQVTLADGEEITATPGGYYHVLSTDRNQQNRAKAFAAFYGIFNAKANTYAAIYNGVLQRDWAYTQARGYETTLAAELDGNNIPTAVYENLVECVRNGAEPLHRYNALRKKALGLDEYHGYDGSATLVDFDKEYPFDEIADDIVASVAPLGEDYQKQMKRIFSGGWIDVYENEGKRSGAFSAGVYGVHPYILLNYNDTLDNFFTAAHEAGHSMHTRLANQTQPFSTSSYTIFVAEVASTLNERLLLDYMLQRTDDPVERAALLTHAIDDIVSTFYSQVMFADFEWQAHRMVERGEPITADSLSELYTSLWKRQQGPAATFDEPYRATWTRIGHFFRTPYYVYQYATCYASSAKLFQDITTGDKEQREAATERYLDLLRAGGSDYPMELLKDAGVDLSDPAAFQAVVDNLGELVDRLEKELEKMERI